MAVTSSDKALLGSAALLAIASAAVFGTLTWRKADAARTPAPTVELAGEPYKPSVENAPPVKAETWGAPGPQSRGRDWIYDAFTSPEIFYNARSRQFTVRPAILISRSAPSNSRIQRPGVSPSQSATRMFPFAGCGRRTSRTTSPSFA